MYGCDSRIALDSEKVTIPVQLRNSQIYIFKYTPNQFNSEFKQAEMVVSNLEGGSSTLVDTIYFGVKKNHNWRVVYNDSAFEEDVFPMEFEPQYFYVFRNLRKSDEECFVSFFLNDRLEIEDYQLQYVVRSPI